MSFCPNEEHITAQQATVLAALRSRPQTTSDFHSLFVLAPARRIMELRRSGLDISTERKGRQAIYALHEGAPS